MFDDHKLRECSATLCCSAYIDEYGGEVQEIVRDNSCMYSYDWWCDEPDWCAVGTDCFDCGTCDEAGGSDDDDSSETVDENSCTVDISGPGTWVGTFEPSDDPYPGGSYSYNYNRRSEDEEDAPVVDLLSKGHGSPAASSATLRMNEQFIFRGKFVPDSKGASRPDPPHLSAPTSPGMEYARPKSKVFPLSLDGARKKTASDARATGNEQVLLLSSSKGPLPRDREARSGAPGGPGGESQEILPELVCALSIFAMPI